MKILGNDYLVRWMKNILNKLQEGHYKHALKTILKYYLSQDSRLFDFKYDDLYQMLSEDKNRYFEIIDYLIKKNLERIRNQIENGKKVRVAFLVYASTIWQYDSIYRIMEKDKRFEPFIVLTTLAEPNRKTSFEQYLNSKRWFSGNGYNLVCVDERNQKYSLDGWKNYNVDILFAAVPYLVFPKQFSAWNACLSTLICYAPYGIVVSGLEKRYFNSKVTSIAWKNFYEAGIQKDNAKKFSPVGDRNVIVSGYLKMDKLISRKSFSSCMWKITEGKKQKRIIYAPHHSLARENCKFSTFDQNYRLILELAKKYDDTTSWVLKPHPMLKRESIEVGLFKNEEEYDAYINEWISLSNATVVTTGDYSDLFLSSDAMILDSESFLLEYHYTHKPILFLRNDSQDFNLLGKILLDACYTAKGDSKTEIEDFVKEVVIGGNDIMQGCRQEMFDNYLDYYTFNGNMLASNYAFENIISSIMNV